MADIAAWAWIALALVFPAVLIVAAVTDVISFTIPNALSIVLAGAFLVLAPIAGLSLNETLFHALAGLATLGLGFGLFLLNVVGGGDVKLLAATAVWTGWPHLGPFLLAVALAGGLVAAALIVARRVARRAPVDPTTRWGRLMSPKEGVPYGVAIAIAGIVVAPRLPIAAHVLEMFAS
ncbi:MAG: prepilin peptidase [Alphaproteobacteria bacterium]